MASTLDMSAADAALKLRFSPKGVQNLVYPQNPFFAMLSKKADVGGDGYKVPVRAGLNRGSSSVFATARTNVYAPNLRAFTVTQNKYYTLAQVDGQVAASTKGDVNAFVDLMALEVKDALQSQVNTLGGLLFRDGTGIIGTLASAPSTGVCTLSSAGDITQFEVGDVLQAYPAGGPVRAALGYVIAVNRDNGTLTVATSGQGGTAASPSGWTTSDGLLIQGNSNNVLTGLAGWLPTTDPTTSDNFFGVNRSIDRTRLAGIVFDGTTMPVVQAITGAQSRLGREGGIADAALCSFATWNDLQLELGAKVQWVNPTASDNPAIAFKGIEIYGPKGPIKVVPDRSCPDGLVYLLQMDTWDLISAMAAPHFDTTGSGGDMWLRLADSDSYQLVVKSYSNLCCYAPGKNAVVQVTTS